MTCTDCERHVTTALQSAGATEVEASYRRGRATFQALPGFAEDALRHAVTEAGYTPRDIRKVGQSGAAAMTSMAESDEYDWVVIGSGSAAFSAAIEARRGGARVAMIERGTVGGTCVNIGCVPSKTLLRASDLHHKAMSNPFQGLRTGAQSPDLTRVIHEKDRLVEDLRQKKYLDLIPEYDIDLIRGEARFLDRERVGVGDRVIKGGRYLIATGARPRVPKIPGLADVDYWTSTSALNQTTCPKHLLIMGSGYIALELGQMFRHWGAEVTLMQRGPVLMPSYDVEVRETVAAVLKESGITVLTGVTYHRVMRREGATGVEITVNGESRTVTGDALLVAAGRDPNTESLNLDAAGIQRGGRGEPVVNATLQTTNSRVYAAGDVTLGPQFVYVAAYEGKLAAQNALALSDVVQTVDLNVVPAVTFTDPSLASVGLSEESAKALGLDVKTSVLPLEAVPRALANRETRGVFKMVAERDSGRIRGVQIVAENAGEVIYAATLAVKFGLSISDLKDTLAPYLTMAEGMKLAALTFDSDVSKLSCCAG